MLEPHTNAELAAALDTLELEVDNFFLLWAAVLIFVMQCGFGMLSAGLIRAHSVKSLLMKNVLDAAWGAIIWWLFGYGLAYGGSNPFAGSDPAHFALSGADYQPQSPDAGYAWIHWFFEWTYAAFAATIVSGALAERASLIGYLVYTTFITGIIYPCVVHWIWDDSGFMSPTNPRTILSGVIDFAGDGAIHMVGGFAALVGAWLLGPRAGRFDQGSETPQEFEAHSIPLVVLGTLILWFGWYGFNCGSVMAVHSKVDVMARIAVTTTLSAASGGATGFAVRHYFPSALGGTGKFEVVYTCNSLMAGLVGITGGCATVSPWAAFVIGIVAALVYHGASSLMRRLKIDDPLDAFAVHGACGVWGLLAVGIFTEIEYSYAPPSGSRGACSEPLTPLPGGGSYCAGTVWGHDSGIFMPYHRGLLFGTQVVAILIIASWVMATSAILFGALKFFNLLRISHEDEARGIDEAKHSGAAYRDIVGITAAGEAAEEVSSGAKAGRADMGPEWRDTPNDERDPERGGPSAHNGQEALRGGINSPT